MFSPPGTGAAAASTTSAGPAAPPAPAANALSNTDLASTLLSHVAAAAASQPAAPAHATPAASAPDGTLSSPLHLATSPTSLRELIDQHDVAIVNFTAPKTCAPCRAIAPHFESLASLRAAELAGRKVAFVEVDLGVGRGSDAAQEWRVSATPTFVFFLRGRKTDELKGASARSLEAAVDRWLWQAFPPHPHESLPLPAVKAVSASPILYSAAPTWPALLGKLLPAIDRASSLTPEQRAEAKRLIEAEVVPFLQTKALAPGRTLEALVTAFAAQTDLLRQHLALDDVFPLYDLWRVALLDPKVCSLATLLSPTSSSSTKPLLHIFTDLFALPPAPPRAYVLTVLRLVANAFSFLGLALLLVSPSSPARTAFTALLVDSLLSPDESVKSAAAAIAFNVASVRHRSAAGAKGPAAVAVSTAQAEAGGEEEGDWALEIVFAVLEAIKNEQKKEDVRECPAALSPLRPAAGRVQTLTSLPGRSRPPAPKSTASCQPSAYCCTRARTRASSRPTSRCSTPGACSRASSRSPRARTSARSSARSPASSADDAQWPFVSHSRRCASLPAPEARPASLASRPASALGPAAAGVDHRRAVMSRLQAQGGHFGAAPPGFSIAPCRPAPHVSPPESRRERLPNKHALSATPAQARPADPGLMSSTDRAREVTLLAKPADRCQEEQGRANSWQLAEGAVVRPGSELLHLPSSDHPPSFPSSSPHPSRSAAHRHVDARRARRPRQGHGQQQAVDRRARAQVGRP